MARAVDPVIPVRSRVGADWVRGATGFTGKSAFTDLANGVRVEVKGEPATGFVTPESIHVN